MSVPAEKLDHQRPVGESLAEILRRMLDANATHAELVVQVGDLQVRLHLTLAGYRRVTPASGTQP